MLMENKIKELEHQISILKMQELIKQAYEQGIEDARSKYSYPELLTRNEAMKLLKVGETKMSELMARQDFPVLREAGVKIPYRLLMKWIEKNTQTPGIDKFHRAI
jgi:hypothetical protein